MKAITIWQPWASLLACGAKTYETRSWATKYRGPIAIHAAAKDPDNCTKGVSDRFLETASILLHNPELTRLPRGCVIATAELVGCWKMEKHPKYEEWLMLDGETGKYSGDGIKFGSNEELFGDWSPGCYAWEFTNMTMLPEPIPAKGSQRLWNWSPEHERM